MNRPPLMPTETQPPKTPWIAFRKPQTDARLRLICFPHAGGGAVTCRGWQKSLPSAVEVCPVELPGRGRRTSQPAVPSVHAIVEQALPHLEPYMDLPFVLFGHSFGSLIAFEMARALRRNEKRAPECLIVSARQPPDRPMHELDPVSLSDAQLVEEIRVRYGGISEQVLAEPELLELFLPVLRADLTAARHYDFADEPPLQCPIVAYGGLDDKTATQTDLGGWGRHTASTFHVHMFAGAHFYLSSTPAPFLATLSDELSRML